MEKVAIFIGNIVHCRKAFELELIQDGFIVVQGRKIIAVDKNEHLSSTKQRLNITEVEEIRLSSSQLLVPGFIDCHLHAPQYPNCGLGYDKPLLEWLDEYTYKLEKQYKDDALSRKVYEAVVKKTLGHGTTTACYFGSLFNSSTLILVEAAIKFGQRALIGKINMTMLAPTDYLETPEESIDNTLKFIKQVQAKNNDLVQPIITPRFALSVDGPMMAKLAEIAREHDLPIQTHISENTAECELVKKVYNTNSYAKVYDDAKLLTPKTILAHGIYLSDVECSLLAERGTSIAHCPESNTCLRSGMCDVRRLTKFGINVGLGSDISGGASPSIVSAMRAAIETSVHLSFTNPEHAPLTWKDVFYLATLGGAKALTLSDKIGNFEAGKQFDALVIDVNKENASCDCLFNYNPLEALQKFIYVGDDRNVVNVYVAGTCVKQ